MAKILTNPREDGEYLNSLARGLAVLKAFSKVKPSMTLSELAQETELNPAVVRRCLNTLIHLGYVGKVDKVFLLRPEVFSLGSAFIESMNLEEVIKPSLQRVRDVTGNSTAMAVMSGAEILFMMYVSTKLLTRIAAGVGTRFPAYATAAGRVMLAAMDKKKLQEYLDKNPLKTLTDRTITNAVDLRKELKIIRKEGFAAIEGELDFGLVSVAVPLRSAPLGGNHQNEPGQVLAALSCSTSLARMSLEEMKQVCVPELQKAAGEIEFELRRSPLLAHAISL